jgi:hypothetical protein
MRGLIKDGIVKHVNIFETTGESGLLKMCAIIKEALQTRMGINPAADRSRGKPEDE